MMLDDICKEIISALRKNGLTYARDMKNIVDHSTETINTHLKHIVGKQVTFQLQGKKKYYFITPKSKNDFEKIDEARQIQLAKIRGYVKKSLTCLEKIDDEESIKLFVKVTKLFFLVFGKIQVYKSGIEKPDLLKTWLKEEEDLKEIFEKIASPKNLECRILIQASLGIDIDYLMKDIENDIKQIEQKNNIKSLE